MLQISRETMAAFERRRLKDFIEAQPERLRAQYPDAFDREFPDCATAQAFVDQLVAEAGGAGISGRADMEVLLDTCVAAGWTSPGARAAAGIEAILSDPAPSGAEKVTMIVNAAAFAAAAGVDPR